MADRSEMRALGNVDSADMEPAPLFDVMHPLLPLLAFCELALLLQDMTNGKPPIDPATLPSWARWLAQDADGTWWAYEHEPNEGAVSWYENEVGAAIRLIRQPLEGDWRRSLVKIR